MTNQSSPENEPDELLKAAMDDMRDPEVASALRAEQAQQPASPENVDLLLKAQSFVDRKYVARADARQKGMGLAYIEAERQDLAREIVRFVESLDRHAQCTREGMARLSASEVACYRWPEDTAEHRAMRAAFCDGAAYTAFCDGATHTAVSSTDGEARS